MTHPAPAGVDARAWAGLTAAPIAHRGLWTPGGAPENSLAAFAAAADAGYGMELDVQRSADGEAMVFHDDRLERMTGAHGRVAGRTAAKLAGLRLAGSGEPIPTLAQVLERVAGRGLVLVELKTRPGEEGPLESRVAEVLARCDGPTAVLSFNPAVLGWFADHAPMVLRGLNRSRRQGAPEAATMARPHFLSLGLDMIPSPRADAFRALGLPMVVWTVRSAEQRALALAFADNLMFEGFRP